MISPDNMLATVTEIQRRVTAFEADAHLILARHESAVRSRTLTVDQTRRKLEGLSLLQNDLLSEALDCIESGLYRAAHVSAWAAFMDFLEQKLAADGLVRVHAARSKWQEHKTIDELRENVPEHQLIEVARVVNLLPKNTMEESSRHVIYPKRLCPPKYI